MKACREIRPLLEWLAADELDGDRRRRAEAHLRDCPACRRELAGWRSLLVAAARPAAATAAELQAIDWDAVTAKIMAGVDARPAPGRGARVFSFAFPGRGRGPDRRDRPGCVFLDPCQRRLRVRSPAGPSGPAVGAMARLQSGLAREEVVSYLQQSQLMLTDLLKDCAGDETAPWEIRLYSRQAKELLLKKKYFQQNLPAAEWLKVRNVSERIDWLNYEILQLRGTAALQPDQPPAADHGK